MNAKRLFVAILALALVTMACGVNINLPVTNVKTGPTVTDQVNVPVPTGEGTKGLKVAFGAGDLTLNSGAEEGSLVSGEISYNVPDFKPDITTDGNNVTIEQGDVNLTGIPNFKGDMVNEWNLNLAADTPMRLEIAAGAYEGEFELGGLSLENLILNDGASTVNLNFAEANKVEMNTLEYNTGASTIELRGLGNANFSNLILHSGAGTYTLDFAGELQRDANVRIESGLSTITIIVPEGVPASVSFDGTLSTVDESGSWTRNGDRYEQTGSGPKITIVIKIGAGTVNLKNQ